MGVEEYESAVIDRYHCPKCAPIHGDRKSLLITYTFFSVLLSIIVKVKVNDHRYAFDDATQNDLVSELR